MIKHAWILKDGDVRYLCNQACGVTEQKKAYKKSEVTCKNCLKAIKKL